MHILGAIMIETASDVIKFWFSEKIKPRWFDSTPAFDQLLRDRYLETYNAAVNGELNEWFATPEGSLALVIIFDQFPLNMFRSKAQGFMTEADARRVANDAIEKQFDEMLSDEQKAFLYMPFMHSETLADQDKSIALYEKAGLNDNLKFSRHHRDIVIRFGRFPHRNEILGRSSTTAEINYLDSPEAFHG